MHRIEKLMEDKIAPIGMKIGSIPQFIAIRDGMAILMPLIIIGSIALLLGNFPITSSWYLHLINQGGWGARFNIIVSGTFDLIGLVGAFGIAYSLASQYKLDAVSNGVMSVVAFLISTPLVMTKDKAATIDLSMMGSKGLFVAIIIGFIVPEIFRFCKNHNFQIKMPDGVPPAVGDSFAALIPGLIIVTIFGGIYWALEAVHFGSLGDLVGMIIGKPFSLLGATFFGAFIYELGTCVFWLCGIHGGNIVGTIMNPMWMQKMDQNRLAMQAGKPLPNILTQPFFDLFVHIGGAGLTLSLAIVMVLFSKSKTDKSLSKLVIVPALFNISEPIMFGLPIVLNPIMFVPFIVAPIMAAAVTYIAMATGLCVRTNGISVPWTTPPIISGWLATGSFTGVLTQIVVIVLGCLIYYPFFKILDKQSLEKEKTSTETEG